MHYAHCRGNEGRRRAFFSSLFFSLLTDRQLCVVGSGGVGKSALVVQFCKVTPHFSRRVPKPSHFFFPSFFCFPFQGKFVERFDPTIEDAYRQQAEVDGEARMLEIYDTAGQEEFSSLRDTYIKASEGFLLVYSVTSVRTFQHAQKLITHIQKVSRKFVCPCRMLH